MECVSKEAKDPTRTINTWMVSDNCDETFIRPAIAFKKVCATTK